MSDDLPTPQQQLIAELKVTAHLMTLDAGVYCVFAGSDSPAPDPTTGLPAVRLTVPPGLLGRGLTLTSVREDGWMGAADAVSLIRVPRGPAHILITIYQVPDSPQEPPRLQVTRLVEGVNTIQQAEPQAIRNEHPPAAPAAQPSDDPTVTGGSDEPAIAPEIVAHIQLRGDVGAQVGDWIGEPGSQRWIEGFAMAPRSGLAADDIEYQAVLGRGWLSPWAEGGQYCGSRGMALPILGLRVRLRGDAADTHRVEVSATFTDGARVGPLGDGEACEAESLAPLEAFQVTIHAAGDVPAPPPAPARRAKAAPIPVPKLATPKAKAPAAKPLPAPAKPKPAPAKAPVKPPRGKGR